MRVYEFMLSDWPDLDTTDRLSPDSVLDFTLVIQSGTPIANLP